MQQIRGVYPPPLDLKCEGDQTSYDFLETVVRVQGPELLVQHRNHNGAAMWIHGNMTRLTRPHRKANWNGKTAVTRLYGELHRLESNCNNDLMVLLAVQELQMELHACGWPQVWLQRAISKYTAIGKSDIWDFIGNQL